MGELPPVNPEWELMAKRDALHAIASDRGRRKGDASAWTPETFFAKGADFVRMMQPGFSRIPSKAHVLDLGCGGGRIVRALAPSYDRVTGLDISPSMVELARKLCSDITNVDFVHYDGRRFPMADASLDAVSSVQVIQHIDRSTVPGLFKEMARVLKPGGHVVLHIPAPQLKQVVGRLLRGGPVRYGLTQLVRRVNPQAKLNSRFWLPQQYNTYSIAKARKMISDAGLVVLEVFRFRETTSLSTVYVATKL